jgi:hypothetical protein
MPRYRKPWLTLKTEYMPAVATAAAAKMNISWHKEPE